MRSFELQNIKSFMNTGEINIKPITVFVGKNSSGKSSLIRFPAVIGQTDYENEAIDFRGKLIDYGYFDDVVFNHLENNIKYKLTFDGSKIVDFLDKDQIDANVYGYIKSFLLLKNTIGIDVSVRKGDKNIFVDSFNLLIDNEVVMNLNKKDSNYKLSIINLDIDDFVPDKVFCFDYNVKFKKCIPQLNFHNRKIENEIYRQVIQGLSKKYENIDFIDEDIINIVGDSEDIIGESNYEREISFENDLEQIEPFDEEFLESEGLIYYKKREGDTAFYNSEDNLFERRKESFFIITKIKTSLIIFSILSDIIFKEINSFSSKIDYLGPFRETPRREYKEKESNIDYVGKSGEDLGTILKQSQTTEKKVSDWLKKALGLELKVENIEDNNQFRIMIYSNNEDKGENLPDVGFGVSQVLPIITQLFYDKSENEGKVVIIEQPELHLHPSAQANLADLFVERIVENDKNIIMIETHSEHLIRKLQVLIADPEVNISNDEVAIYYVDKSSNGESKVQEMQITESGQFSIPWPKGFFDKSYDLSIELLRKSRKRGQ